MPDRDPNQEALEAATEAHMPWTWPNGSSVSPTQRRAMMESALEAALAIERPRIEREIQQRLERLIAEHKRTNVAPRRRDRELYKGVAAIFEEAE